MNGRDKMSPLMISHVLSVIPRKEPKERNEAMKEDKDEV
jgi:hypothetical protein